MGSAVLKIVGGTGIALGALLIILAGVIGWVVVPNTVEDKIKEETRLIADTETWDKWSDIKIPMRLKFYIYNVTNPEALTSTFNLTEKLNFVEMGPYVYNEYRHKVDVVFSDDGEELSYKQKILYLFNEQESEGTEDDLFTIPNIPVISVATVGWTTKEDTGTGLNQVSVLMLNLFNFGENFFVKNLKVREILFDGWKLNPFYTMIPDEDFPADFGTKADPRFGLYKGRNGADDGEYLIKTGLNDDTEFGETVTWTQPGSNVSQSELEWWYPTDLPPEQQNTTHTFCNAINGSDGSIYPPFNDDDTTLRLFQTDVCRSLHLTYLEDMEYRDIPGKRFAPPEALFDSDHPDNACFCPNPSPLFPDRAVARQCTKGVIRIFPCKHGAPVVTSNPHFLYGAPELFEPIEITQPDPVAHMTYVDIEADSGMVLRLSKKVQINVELQYMDKIAKFNQLNFTTFTNADSILLPVMWADETAELDKTSAKALYDKLLKPQKLANVLRWVGIGLGVVVLLLGGALVYKSF